MAKKDNDLFHRLHAVGLRKQVAKGLSEIGEGAGKKAVRAARAAANELRTLADEIEQRLPAAEPAQAPPEVSLPAEPIASPAAAESATVTAASAPSAGATPAAPGENRLKILASLQSGPKTASEIGDEIGASRSTVSSALAKMAAAGEVVKAPRGYALPE
jgi:hypothetical protein